MHLSPIAHYAVRQLLKQHAEGLNAVTSEAGKRVAFHETTDINLLLNRLYPRKFEAVTKIRNLETLISIYRRLEPRNSYDLESLAEIKRRIFQLLGLRLGITAAAILPTVFPEQSVSSFQFYFAEQIREGIQVKGKLYGIVYAVEGAHRNRVYELAWALSEQGFHCVVTLSESRYAIWVPLRSPVYLNLLHQGNLAIERILAVYSLISKLKMSILNQKPGAAVVEASSLYRRPADDRFRSPERV